MREGRRAGSSLSHPRVLCRLVRPGNGTRRFGPRIGSICHQHACVPDPTGGRLAVWLLCPWSLHDMGENRHSSEQNQCNEGAPDSRFRHFHLLEEISEDGCCQYEHPSRPRAKGKREVSRRGHRLIFGRNPDQNSNASYVSECVIAQPRKNGGARVFRPVRPGSRTSSAGHPERSFPSECHERKGSRNVELWPFAA